MKLRLLVTKNCNRQCKGCCNNDWDLDSLSMVDDWSKYDEIIITGGEPMLYPEKLHSLLQSLTAINPLAKYYLYTAAPNRLARHMYLFKYLNGATITLHTGIDWKYIKQFDDALHEQDIFNPFKRSLRINHFEEAKYEKFGPDIRYSLYDIKWNMQWREDCPLPDGEEFRRIGRLW